MTTPKLETKFDEDKSLREFLSSGRSDIPGTTRHIVGKSLFSRHCGERRLKIQEIHHVTYNNGRLELTPLGGGKLLYCVRCGDIKDTYPLE